MKKPRSQKKGKQKRQQHPTAAPAVRPQIALAPLSIPRQFFAVRPETSRKVPVSRAIASSYSDDDRQALALLLLPVFLLAFMIGINQTFRDGLRSFDDVAHVEPAATPTKPAKTETALASPALRLPSSPPSIAVPEPRPDHALAFPAGSPSVDTHDLALAAPAMRVPPAAPEIEPPAPVVVASLLALPKQVPFVEPADPVSGYACLPPAKSEVRLASPPPDTSGFGVKLAAAARAQIPDFVVYDDRYRSIGYPMGDVPSFYGVCTDVVIRAYRTLGYDLQALVHESRLGRGDTSIDHRRTETLRRFFEKYGESLVPSADPADYLPGDIVTYYRPNNRRSRSHIVIVADRIGPSGQPMIIHNRGFGVQMEDTLFMDPITGHYRFTGIEPRQSAEAPPAKAPPAKSQSAPPGDTALKINASLQSERPAAIASQKPR